MFPFSLSGAGRVARAVGTLAESTGNAIYHEVDERQKQAPVLRDAYVFILPLLLAAVSLALVGLRGGPLFYWAAGVAFLLALFVAFFFRNPRREVPTDPNLVVSPADGRVVVVRPLGPEEAPGGGTLVSIFLSVFDVHINRAPVAGTITRVEYRRGKFKSATGERTSVENEQNVVTVRNEHVEVTFKQIAGLIARRIVFWHRVGGGVGRGERVGLIKFGSRTDLILPPQVIVGVRRGERVKGGVSVIGKVNS